jgi:nicotinamide-nucleotide amidase
MAAIDAEIISIGDELLSGKLNRNSAFISRKLLDLGFNVSRLTTIPDDQEIIMETFAESMACAPLVIATGGLGPTLDDVTRQAAALLFESPLEYNEELAEALRNQFGDHPAIREQAKVSQKAELLMNRLGSACGMIFFKGHSLLILLPGVPQETELLMDEQVAPFLLRTFPSLVQIPQVQLHFANLYEVQMDPTLRSLKELEPDLQLGIYPHNGLVTVSVKGDEKALRFAEKVLDQHFGAYRYLAEDGKIETAIHRIFLERKWTLACAESCTGGSIASRLTALPGASGYFLGSIVAYANAWKRDFLGVPQEGIERFGAVSSEVAEAMAEYVQAKTGATFSLAITGIAGPEGGTAEKPVGTIYIALKKEDQKAKSHLLQTTGTRTILIQRAVNWSLGLLHQSLGS